MAQDLELSDAARLAQRTRELAQRTREWQASAPGNEGRFPRRHREGEEGPLADAWEKMKRLHLEDLSAWDIQVLCDVPGVDWDKLTLSHVARLAKRTREWQAAAPGNKGRFPTRDHEGEEGLLARVWNDTLRLRLDGLSASDRQVLRDVAGVNWEQLPAVLAMDTRS